MLRYRECSERDCSVWIKMNRAFMKEEIQAGDVWNDANLIGESEFRDLFMEGLQSPDHVRFLLFEEDEEPVGFANLVLIFSVWSHGTAMIVDDFFFSQGSRGAGFGRRAMEMIEDYARSLGCKRLQLQASLGNENAIEFYNALGYESADMDFFVKYL